MESATTHHEAVRACMLSHFSRVGLFASLWTVAHQTPLSTGFFRQEYWSGLPCPPPEDIPNPGIKPRSPTLQADSLPSEPPVIISFFLDRHQRSERWCFFFKITQHIEVEQGLEPGFLMRSLSFHLPRLHSNYMPSGLWEDTPTAPHPMLWRVPHSHAFLDLFRCPRLLCMFI